MNPVFRFGKPRLNRRNPATLRVLRFRHFVVRCYGTRRECRKHKRQILLAKVLHALYRTIEARLRRFDVALAEGVGESS